MVLRVEEEVDRRADSRRTSFRLDFDALEARAWRRRKRSLRSAALAAASERAVSGAEVFGMVGEVEVAASEVVVESAGC